MLPTVEYNGYVSIHHKYKDGYTVLPAKSDSDVMFCLHHYQGLMIDRSHVY